MQLLVDQKRGVGFSAFKVFKLITTFAGMLTTIFQVIKFYNLKHSGYDYKIIGPQTSVMAYSGRFNEYIWGGKLELVESFNVVKYILKNVKSERCYYDPYLGLYRLGSWRNPKYFGDKKLIRASRVHLLKKHK